ncbi:MAG TPA: ABC transporter permease [Vicinamibacterales bacterium]|nr:ABC transporter permease [Vicinamibacterales bacterium]
MIGTITAVAHKELRQIVRDRRTLLTVLFVPAFILLLYGYALNFDIRNIPLAVHDRDGSRASREVISAFVNSGYFDLVGLVHSPHEMDRLIDRGDARAVLVIPAGFGRDVANRVPVRLQIVIDGDNANTATTAMGYATAITAEASASLQSAIGIERRDPPVVLEPRVWYNPELRSTLFLVPGLIAFIAMITAVVSTALSVVREKERGTMEQVRMSPLSPLSFIVGKTVPFVALSSLSSLLVVLAAMALFDMPVRGSWLLLGVAVTIFLVGALAQGLLISTLADTQQVAFQAALLSSFLPTFILSGFVFPIGSMPWPIQLVTYVVPARYFLAALRAIVLKGAGVEAFAGELGAMAVFSIAMLSLASIRLAREWA